MRKRKKLTTTLALLALAIALSGVISLWETRRVQAIQDSEDRPNPFGLIELEAGQTARLNVLLGNPDERPGDERRARRVRLAFDIYRIQDEENRTNAITPGGVAHLTFLRRESHDVTLLPGEGASFDFNAVEGTKVAASIRSLGGPDTRPEDQISANRHKPELVPTLEVRQGSRTLFMVPALAKLFNPQPDPPGHQ